MTKEHEPIPTFLIGETPNTVQQDEERRALPEIEIDPSWNDLKALAEDKVVAQAADTITKEADVPYFASTDSLARDISTKIGESEHRISEINDDIEASGKHRDELVMRADAHYDAMIQLAELERSRMIDLANSNHLQELAILRGRETDLVRILGTLRQALSSLQR